MGSDLRWSIDYSPVTTHECVLTSVTLSPRYTERLGTHDDSLTIRPNISRSPITQTLYVKACPSIPLAPGIVPSSSLQPAYVPQSSVPRPDGHGHGDTSTGRRFGTEPPDVLSVHEGEIGHAGQVEVYMLDLS
jgi:hypothetical protein